MKIVKWILIISFFFLVIFASVLVWFYTSNPQKIIEILSKQTRKTYALDFIVRDAGFNLLKGIELKGIQIMDVSSQSNDILMTFREGSIVYNPLALFFKKIEILSITAAGLETSFENITNLADRLQKIPPSQSNDIQFVVHRLEISDSRLIYNKILYLTDLKILPDRSLEEMPVELALRSKTGSLNYSGTINKGRVSVKDARIDEIFQVETSFRIDSFQGLMTRDKDNLFHFSGSDIKIFYENFLFEAAGSYTGDYNWEKQIISLQNTPVKVGRSSSFITNLVFSIPDAKLIIQATNTVLAVNDFLKDASGSISGDFTLNVNKDLFLSGSLYLSNFQYQWLKISDGPFSLEKNSLKLDLAINTPGGNAQMILNCADIFSRGVSISLESGEFDAASFLSNIPPDKGGSPDTNQPAVFKIYPVDFEINIKKLLYQKLEFSAFHLAGTADESSIVFKDAQADALRGKIYGKGGISQSVLSGNVVIKDCRLKEFSALYLDGEKRLYGPLSADLDFKIPLNDIKLSAAVFEADILSGEIKDFFLQGEIAQTLYDIPLNDIFFDKIHLKGSLENQTLKFSRVQFDSSDIKVQAEGEYSLQNKKISARSEISFSKSYLSELPNVTQIYTSGFEEGGRIVFKVGLEGDINKPEVKIEDR